MTIYAKDAVDFKLVPIEKKKRASKKKEERELPEDAIEIGSKKDVHPEHPDRSIKQLPAVKKPLTEAQIAGRAKAAETRRLKKEAKLKETEKLTKGVAAKAKAVSAKTEAPKTPEGGIRKPRQRKKKSEAVENDNDTLIQSPVAAAAVPDAPKKRKPKAVKDVEEDTPVKKQKTAPKIIEKMVASHIENEVRNSGETKSKKEIKSDAREAAQQIWNDPVLKPGIDSLNDSHMQKMYAMIFPQSRYRLSN